MNKFIWLRIFFTLMILITALSMEIFYETRPHLAPGQAPLKDIDHIETLRTQFNSDTGKTRLIILVSPTWWTCLAGARRVQSHILAQDPSPDFRVYAVWIPMLRGDSREAWDGNTMPDNRVIHFWDGKTEVGQWFALEVDGYQGTAWNAFYLYGPDATWKDVPAPLLGSGVIVDNQHEPIDRQISSLVK